MHRRQPALASAIVPAIVLGAILAACTAPSGGGANPTATPATTPAATQTSEPMESSMPDGVTIEVRQDGMYGSVLEVDGRSVYLFTPDPAGGAGTACLEGCIANWPAVLVPDGTEPVTGAGLTGSLTTFERPDGGRQVAYEGHPLYFFVGDAAPGDTAGQGVNDVWFLVTPAGDAAAVGGGATPAPQESESDDPYDY
jgi:predicted lipoprotein with Yx(FWY)xxD motif